MDPGRMGSAEHSGDKRVATLRKLSCELMHFHDSTHSCPPEGSFNRYSSMNHRCSGYSERSSKLCPGSPPGLGGWRRSALRPAAGGRCLGAKGCREEPPQRSEARWDEGGGVWGAWCSLGHCQWPLKRQPLNMEVLQAMGPALCLGGAKGHALNAMRSKRT